MFSDKEIREIFKKETREDLEDEKRSYKHGLPRLPRNLNKRNSFVSTAVSTVLVRMANGLMVPQWATHFLGVNEVSRFYTGYFPWELIEGTKAEGKFFTMLAEIKVKWFSADPLALAKELFLHGMLPVCQHPGKVIDIAPPFDTPDRGSL